MRRFQVWMIALAILSALAASVYYYGLAITVIYIVCIINLIVSLRSFKALKKLIVASQHVLGENDKKLMKKLQSIEDRLDG